MVRFSATTRRFDGEIDLGEVPSGNYALIIKPTTFLAHYYGVVPIVGGARNEMTYSASNVILSCDFNNDNLVNQLDLNQMYTDLIVGNKNVASLADINRNGRVDIFDHNFCARNLLKKGADIIL